MKKAISALTITALSALVFSCTSVQAQEPKTEARTTGTFTGIDVGGAFEVEILQGSECAVKLDVYDGSLLAKIKTEVRGNILHVETKDIDNVKGKLKVSITAPTYTHIEISGAAMAHTPSAIKAASLNLDISGVAHADFSINADKLDADLSGASDIKLNGTATYAHLDVSGATQLHGTKMEISTCRMEVSGASDASVNVSRTLDVDASGASHITYTGNPEKKIDLSGAASVSQAK